VAEHDGTEWAGEKCDREGCERGKQRRRRIAVWEEQRREDEDRSRRIDVEIEELDRRAALREHRLRHTAVFWRVKQKTRNKRHVCNRNPLRSYRVQAADRALPPVRYHATSRCALTISKSNLCFNFSLLGSPIKESKRFVNHFGALIHSRSDLRKNRWSYKFGASDLA
jgi:hypothetical protein